MTYSPPSSPIVAITEAVGEIHERLLSLPVNNIKPVHHYVFSISTPPPPPPPPPPYTTTPDVTMLSPYLHPHSTPRFSGAHRHHYLLDFLQSVAECYRDDERAGDLVVDLLKLQVPKLFAVEGGREEDEAVRCEFSRFLRKYILLECDILEKMSSIMVREPNHQVFCEWTLFLNNNMYYSTTLYSFPSLPPLRMQSQTSMMSSSS